LDVHAGLGRGPAIGQRGRRQEGQHEVGRGERATLVAGRLSALVVVAGEVVRQRKKTKRKGEMKKGHRWARRF
jgi:hypothetical protein